MTRRLLLSKSHCSNYSSFFKTSVQMYSFKVVKPLKPLPLFNLYNFLCTCLPSLHPSVAEVLWCFSFDFPVLNTLIILFPALQQLANTIISGPHIIFFLNQFGLKLFFFSLESHKNTHDFR